MRRRETIGPPPVSSPTLCWCGGVVAKTPRATRLADARSQSSEPSIGLPCLVGQLEVGIQKLPHTQNFQVVLENASLSPREACPATALYTPVWTAVPSRVLTSKTDPRDTAVPYKCGVNEQCQQTLWKCLKKCNRSTGSDTSPSVALPFQVSSSWGIDRKIASCSAQPDSLSHKVSLSAASVLVWPI